jgi:hypothetical protein
MSFRAAWVVAMCRLGANWSKCARKEWFVSDIGMFYCGNKEAGCDKNDERQLILKIFHYHEFHGAKCFNQ